MWRGLITRSERIMALSVQIITPERSWDPVPADAVILPAFDGEVGILRGHAPFVCLLGEGELRINRDQGANQ